MVYTAGAEVREHHRWKLLGPRRIVLYAPYSYVPSRQIDLHHPEGLCGVVVNRSGIRFPKELAVRDRPEALAVRSLLELDLELAFNVAQRKGVMGALAGL